MNLNYNNTKIEDFNDEIRNKYAFPENKDLIQKYMRAEIDLSTEDIKGAVRNAYTDFFWIGTSLTLGTIGYCYLQMPFGKVIRDKYDAEMPLPKRYLRRLIPFFGLIFPIIIVKNRLIKSNGYID